MGRYVQAGKKDKGRGRGKTEMTKMMGMMGMARMMREGRAFQGGGW